MLFSWCVLAACLICLTPGPLGVRSQGTIDVSDPYNIPYPGNAFSSRGSATVVLTDPKNAEHALTGESQDVQPDLDALLDLQDQVMHQPVHGTILMPRVATRSSRGHWHKVRRGGSAAGKRRRPAYRGALDDTYGNPFPTYPNTPSDNGHGIILGTANPPRPPVHLPGPTYGNPYPTYGYGDALDDSYGNPYGSYPGRSSQKTAYRGALDDSYGSVYGYRDTLDDTYGSPYDPYPYPPPQPHPPLNPHPKPSNPGGTYGSPYPTYPITGNWNLDDASGTRGSIRDGSMQSVQMQAYDSGYGTGYGTGYGDEGYGIQGWSQKVASKFWTNNGGTLEGAYSPVLEQSDNMFVMVDDPVVIVGPPATKKPGDDKDHASSTTEADASTTEAATTEDTTTEAATTEATTEDTTTAATTTEAPTTEAPTTEAPTTEAPTTEAPTTAASETTTG